MVISLIFNNYSHYGYFFVFPNLVIAGIVYISAYLDIYSGGIMSYILFYIYGSMTPLDPTLFGFIGVVSYAVSYILWRKISSDNFLSEILITFFSSSGYYLVLFLIVYYRLGIHFIYLNFIFSYGLPASVATALISPAIFFFFKKIGYKNFLKRNQAILD